MCTQSGASLYIIYNSVSQGCFLYCPPKVPMMKVPCHFSRLHFSASVFLLCQNSDKTVRVLARGALSSAARQPTALCANHNQRAPPPPFPLVHPLGTRYMITERKTTWSEEKLVKDTRYSAIYCWNNHCFTTFTRGRRVQLKPCMFTSWLLWTFIVGRFLIEIRGNRAMKPASRFRGNASSLFSPTVCPHNKPTVNGGLLLFWLLQDSQTTQINFRPSSWKFNEPSSRPTLLLPLLKPCLSNQYKGREWIQHPRKCDALR